MIHLFIVLLVVPAGDVVHPCLVVQVPPYGLLYPLLELEARLPAKLPLYLRAVDRVPHVVPRTVGDERDEVKVRTLRPAKKPVHRPDHDPDEVDVLPLVESADVVRVGCPAPVEDKVDRLRVVLHVEPVTYVLALAVHRQRLPVPDVVDEKRYQLLRELVRTVVVAAVRNYSGHPVGVVERTHEMVAAGLRRGIGTVGTISRVLTEELPTVCQMVLRRRGRSREGRLDAFRVRQLQRTVHLVRGDMVEQLAHVLLRKGLPVQLRRLEHRQGAQDIGLREGEGILDRAVHVALRGQVDHSVRPFLPHQPVHPFEVADVHLHETVVRTALDVPEVGKVAGVGKLVKVDDHILGIPVDEKAHHMASYEARAAGDYDCSFIVHIDLFLSDVFQTCFQRVCPVGHIYIERLLDSGLVQYRICRTLHRTWEFVAVAGADVA